MSLQEIPRVQACEMVVSLYNEKKLEEFIERNGINVKLADGISLLCAAKFARSFLVSITNTEQIKLIKTLLNHNIDVNSQDESFLTVIDYFHATFNLGFHLPEYTIFKMLMFNGAKNSQHPGPCRTVYEIADAKIATFLSECDYETRSYKSIIMATLFDVDIVYNVYHGYNGFYDVERAFVFDIMIATFY